MTTYLDFEKPLAEIEGKAEELRALARQSEGMDVEAEAARLIARPPICCAISTNRSRLGANAKWLATPTARIAVIISARCLQNIRPWPVTGILLMITR